MLIIGIDKGFYLLSLLIVACLYEILICPPAYNLYILVYIYTNHLLSANL